MSAGAHEVTVLRARHVPAGAGTRFYGRCACGATSGLMTAAGQVHGWHNRHLAERDEEGAPRQ